MDVNEIKRMLSEKSIDPLLLMIANKGYKWIIEDNSTEEEAAKFEQYILNSTTDKELEEIRSKKKSVKDFMIWKYVSHLDRCGETN